jgi:competence protein ComGC
MRPTPIHKSEAFTRIELIVVIVVVFVLLAIFYPLADLRSARAPAYRISCINNLKQIGTAYRVWENDHGDRYPALQSVAKGGWNELLTNADQGFLCWTNYAIMAIELGKLSNEFVQFPKGLVCPSDERKPAETFTGTNRADSDFKDNRTLSYFVGVSANDSHPESLLGGDRNLGAGTEPDRHYGFSPKSGKGNDVAIATNAQADPVCWSLKMHSLGKSYGGNILLGDESVQQVSTFSFRRDWQAVAGLTTNWPVGHVPSSPSIRVLFP